MSLTTADALPEFTEFSNPDFGTNFDWVADDLFQRDYQGLLQGGDYGLIAYRSADLRGLGNHDDVSHQEHLFGREEGGMDRFMRVSTFAMRPPEHRPAKGIISRQLAAKSMNRFADTAAGIVDELISEAAERGEIDFFEEFTRPLQARFWGSVLGLSPEEIERIGVLLDDFFLPFLLHPTEEQLTAADKATDDFIDLITTVLEREMETGSHEILVDLAADCGAMPEGDRPSNVCRHFGVALPDGFNTLGLLTMNTVYSLLAEPEALAEVRRDRTLVANAWLEGSRLHPTVVGTQRGAHADLEWDGVSIPDGTPIMMMWAFGNRDPAVWDEPNEFRLHRDMRTRQSTFGTGLYICPGRHTARIVGETVLRALTAPGVEVVLAGDVRWKPGSLEHRPLHMPVAITRTG